MLLSRKKWLLLALAGSLLLGRSTASADLLQVLPELGDLERWALFTVGTGKSGDQLSGDVEVQGDVGVAGNGKIALGQNATIEGDLYYRSNGAFVMSGHASVPGSLFHDQDPLLNNGVSEAYAASNRAFALQPTSPITNVNLTGTQSAIVSGALGETVVLRLKNFTLSGSSTFTLQGTASTTFIINVSKKFSLADTAQILLSGGLQWDDVLFNVRGKGNVKISGQSQLEGFLLAANRTVRLSDQSIVRGEIVANRVLLGGGSQIVHPPTASP